VRPRHDLKGHTVADLRIGTCFQVGLDAKGCCIDNVCIERLWRSLRQECLYLHGWEIGSQAKTEIDWRIAFRNHGPTQPMADSRPP
jgi:hypothetical protein